MRRRPFDLENNVAGQGLEVERKSDSLSYDEAYPQFESGDTLERGEGPNVHLRWMGMSLILVFVLIFGRLYYLAVANHEYYREIAEGNRLRVEYLAAPRGAIYDKNGLVLATNRPSFELVVTPLDLAKDPLERARVIARVAEILQIPVLEIDAIGSNQDQQSFQSILIRQNIAREQALIFNEQAHNLPGFHVLNIPIRDYYQSEFFAHILGYVGKVNPEEYQEKSTLGYLYNDSLGKTGVERIYEDFLRGKFGEKQVEVDARGIIKKEFGEKEPLPGNNIHLNIDAGLQEKLHETIVRRLKGTGKRRVAAVAMHPQDGRILAYVSLPSYDNNLFAEGIKAGEYEKLLNDQDLPFLNRPIAGLYPPGSTVKPIVAAAALQEKVVSPRTRLHDEGQIVVKNIYGGPDSYFYGYNRKALGLLDVRRAIALSSDIFFYMVSGGYEPRHIEGLGIETLTSYYRRFKLHEKLGIDLPGERDGLVPDPEWKKQRFGNDQVASRWYLGDTYHIAIGQGDLLVTPLHVISWISAIANGGKIYRPRLADRIETNDRQLLKKFEPEIIGELGIDQEYLKVVREGMREVVTSGTAKSLNTLSLAVAGKTGTAQFDARNRNRAHAWFTAFAPYENPQIAIVVLVEDGGEGSLVSAPIVKDVLEWWARERYLKNK